MIATLLFARPLPFGRMFRLSARARIMAGPIDDNLWRRLAARIARSFPKHQSTSSIRAALCGALISDPRCLRRRLLGGSQPEPPAPDRGSWILTT
jgi:hypothetical protein